VDYNKDLDNINYDELKIKDILDYIYLIDSYIYNKFGSEQKNDLILNRLFNELIIRIDYLSQMWCENNFINSLEISNKNKILQTKISTDLMDIINTIFNVCPINTFCHDGKLLLLTIKNIKNYIVSSVEKMIVEKINQWEKSGKLENLIAISNDLEYIKNESEKFINFDKLALESGLELKLNPSEKDQIKNELGEINYIISNNLDNILNIISNIITSDFENEKNSINLQNLQLQVITTTLDDYLHDLVNWMLYQNLISLIEKLHIRIINSDLIEKISEPRNKFEEYIRIKLKEFEKLKKIENFL
jgi:hypothetical protein